MRLPVVPAALVAASLLTGCTSVLAEPEFRVSPYLALYQLRGEVGMQSVPATPGPAQDNPRQPLRRFGQDRYREDVGVRVDIGDGFGGLRADYYRLDMNTSQDGQLQSDWGRLLAGDFASIYAEMDELRLGYVEPLWDHTTDYRDEDLRLRLGAGGVLATRQIKLRGREDSNTRTQNQEIEGERLFVAVRAQADWQDFTLSLDVAVSPDALVLSGDLEDFSQDLEARLAYRLPQRDIQFFAGVRYSRFSASGDANGFRYDSELIIDGVQLGMQVTL